MAKQDGRKNNGGHKGCGRKSKAQEMKAVSRIKRAIKGIYSDQTEDEEEALDMFLQTFGRTKDGMKFFAEHLLGKAPDKVEIEDVTPQLSIEEKRKLLDKYKEKLKDAD